MTQTLLKAAQDMLDAVKALSTAQGIDWTNPAYAPVALAHNNLTDAIAPLSSQVNPKPAAYRAEQEADEAIQTAVQALTKAAELSERAGYGSEIRLALSDAQKSVDYALKTVRE